MCACVCCVQNCALWERKGRNRSLVGESAHYECSDRDTHARAHMTAGFRHSLKAVGAGACTQPFFKTFLSFLVSCCAVWVGHLLLVPRRDPSGEGTYLLTYVRTYIYICTYMYTYMHAGMHTCIQYVHECMHAYVHVHVHMAPALELLTTHMTTHIIYSRYLNYCSSHEKTPSSEDTYNIKYVSANTYKKKTLLTLLELLAMTQVALHGRVVLRRAGAGNKLNSTCFVRSVAGCCCSRYTTAGGLAYQRVVA
jgi:hypothetical protein